MKKKARLSKRSTTGIRLLYWIVGWTLRPDIPVEWKSRVEITLDWNMNKVGNSQGTVTTQYKFRGTLISSEHHLVDDYRVYTRNLLISISSKRRNKLQKIKKWEWCNETKCFYYPLESWLENVD